MTLRCCAMLLVAGCELAPGNVCNEPCRVDAGIDGGPMDAGVDAGLDAGVRDGATDDAPPDAGPPSVISLAAGERHNCAVFDDGAVYCWGDNAAGQLGGGGGGFRRVPADSPMLEVCAGSAFSCARARDGSVWCWGDDTYSQLGAPGVGPLPTQVVFGPLVRAARIVCGAAHACIVDEVDQLYCWGRNNNNAIDGSLDDTVAPPRRVIIEAGLSVQGAALGTSHTCALAGDREVYCWGANFSHEVASTSDPILATPYRRGGTNGTGEISAGSGLSCRTTSTGAVDCWGLDLSGQVSAAPTALGHVAIEAGVAHACAIGATGAIVCWGENAAAQLGVVDMTDRQHDVGVPPATSVVCGSFHSCALGVDGDLHCWGSNELGQVTGIATPGELLAPTRVEVR